MMSSQKLLWIAAFLLCISAARLYSEVPEESRCFTIHVRLNGKPIAGPKMLTFKTREMEKSALAEGACFKVPPAVLHEKDVDVLFIVPGNKVYLSTIPTAFLAGSWDIDLADRRFGRDVVLPRHTRAKEACAVIFHVGEPETARTLSGCRTMF